MVLAGVCEHQRDTTPRADYIITGPQEYDPEHPALQDVSHTEWKQVQGKGFYDLLSSCDPTNEYIASAVTHAATTQNATQFVSLLKDMYEGIGRVAQHQAITKANQLTMDNFTVAGVRKFCTAFQKLINIVYPDKQAPRGSELYEALCRKIPNHLISKDSLHDEYQNGAAKYPTTLKIMVQLQKVAQDLEYEEQNTGLKPHIHVATSDTQSSDSKSTDSTSTDTVKCQLCGKQGHTADKCRNRGPYRGRGYGHRGRGRGGRGSSTNNTDSHDRTPPKSLDNIVCHRCGGEGHYARQCPSSHDKRYCNYCRKYGHTTESCWFCPQANFAETVDKAVQEALAKHASTISQPTSSASNVSVNHSQAHFGAHSITPSPFYG